MYVNVCLYVEKYEEVLKIKMDSSSEGVFSFPLIARKWMDTLYVERNFGGEQSAIHGISIWGKTP